MQIEAVSESPAHIVKLLYVENNEFRRKTQDWLRILWLTLVGHVEGKSSFRWLWRIVPVERSWPQLGVFWGLGSGLCCSNVAQSSEDSETSKKTFEWKNGCSLLSRKSFRTKENRRSHSAVPQEQRLATNTNKVCKTEFWGHQTPRAGARASMNLHLSPW